MPKKTAEENLARDKVRFEEYAKYANSPQGILANAGGNPVYMSLYLKYKAQENLVKMKHAGESIAAAQSSGFRGVPGFVVFAVVAGVVVSILFIVGRNRG